MEFPNFDAPAAKLKMHLGGWNMDELEADTINNNMDSRQNNPIIMKHLKTIKTTQTSNYLLRAVNRQPGFPRGGLVEPVDTPTTSRDHQRM